MRHPSKRSKQTLSVIEFDPRRARYREAGVSMWETQLQFTYSNYALDREESVVRASENVVQ